MEPIKDNKYKIGTIIKHLKRGSIYEIINVGYIESTLTPAYSYRCLSDDVIWHRPITEVEDTDRFIKMETAIIFMNAESKSGLTVFDNDRIENYIYRYLTIEEFLNGDNETRECMLLMSYLNRAKDKKFPKFVSYFKPTKGKKGTLFLSILRVFLIVSFRKRFA